MSNQLRKLRLPGSEPRLRGYFGSSRDSTEPLRTLETGVISEEKLIEFGKILDRFKGEVDVLETDPECAKEISDVIYVPDELKGSVGT